MERDLKNMEKMNRKRFDKRINTSEERFRRDYNL
jgi:hypothetical protein